jgi:TPR repeat protein
MAGRENFPMRFPAIRCVIVQVRDFCFAALVVLTVGFNGTVSVSWAGFDEGLAAYHREDYVNALQELRPLAEQGDARAQNVLGAMYQQGQGVPKDNSKAVSYYLKAAAQGYVTAQTNLGFIYSDGGELLPKDYSRAHMWLNMAASKGDKEAVKQRNAVEKLMTAADFSESQRLAREWKVVGIYYREAARGDVMSEYTLGAIYYEGHRGVQRDYVEAVKWYKRAASRGYLLAQTFLGDMYANGHGVPKDFVRAHMWFNLASIGGFKSAEIKRNQLEQKMTNVEISDAQRMMRKWNTAK